MTTSILLIDDDESWLDELAVSLDARLTGQDISILKWVPRLNSDPMVVFESFLSNHDVRLVVTDYDLTSQGQLGFFGATVVDWCQAQAVPVADFSRYNASSLAKEPNLFELRVPVASHEMAAAYIATVSGGFLAIRSAIDEDPSLLNQRSPAAALTKLLEMQGQTGQFSQYGIRYGGANSALIDWFRATASPDVEPSIEKRTKLLAYIMGHLLMNAILRFPGPLLDRRALAAYLAVDPHAYDQIEQIVMAARYGGPFADLHRGPFFWTEKVDDILQRGEEQIDPNESLSSPGKHNRRLAEILLQRGLPLDGRCTRCEGDDGGFLCPFSDRTVCQRADCSVISNVWIPAGARLSRFERDFYEEWAPILGM